MKIFVNYLKNYGKTKDTAIHYPKNITRICEYVSNIQTEVNHSRIQPIIQKLIKRIKATRFSNWFQAIPHDVVYIPVSQVKDYDLVFNSYIYPKYLGLGHIPPNILRINYQTDRVLISRDIKNLKERRNLISKRWTSFDAVITTTNFSVPLIQQECSSLASKIYYCPNFLPDARVISSEKFQEKVKDNLIKILFVGRDGFRKGLKELILALSKLELECKKKIDLTIISETEFDDNLLKDIKFQFFKSASNSGVLDYMEKAHIFCLPTKSEAYGIVFVEAMSKGCAIISDNDLPRLELIKSNQCGICVDPENITQIKNALKQLILDQKLRETYMENSLKTFESEYSPKIVAQKHKQIFQEVINESNQSNVH